MWEKGEMDMEEVVPLAAKANNVIYKFCERLRLGSEGFKKKHYVRLVVEEGEVVVRFLSYRILFRPRIIHEQKNVHDEFYNSNFIVMYTTGVKELKKIDFFLIPSKGEEEGMLSLSSEDQEGKVSIDDSGMCEKVCDHIVENLFKSSFFDNTRGAYSIDFWEEKDQHLIL